MGYERPCEGSKESIYGGLGEKVLQSRKAATDENMKCSAEKIIAIKAGTNLPHFKANLYV